MKPVAWIAHSFSRIYGSSQAEDRVSLRLDAARNDQVSFQVACRNQGSKVLRTKVSIESRGGLGIRVRRQGLVPMPRYTPDTERAELEGVAPGMVPDPLFPETEATVGPFETQAFWVNVRIPPDARPETHRLTVRVECDGELAALLASDIVVHALVAGTGKPFPVLNWIAPDCIADWYGLEPYSPRYWVIVEPYIENIVSHHGSSIYVPLFTPPTDGNRRPCQLLGVSGTPGSWNFDFSRVAKWAAMAKKKGASYFEWPHLFAQWGVKHALKVYRENGDPESLLWDPETPAMDPKYREFLASFLPKFKAFLDSEGILDSSFFHLSDEPKGPEHLDNYRRARSLLAELAPWMKVSDALSEVDYAKLGLVDLPISVISSAREFKDSGIECFVYFCCLPRGAFLNRFLDTPLAKIRMAGWLFHALGAKGFLHWGYNYWYRSQTTELVDPFQETGAHRWPDWSYGDPFEVYPGPEGPIDSIRWEVFSDSLADLNLLRSSGLDGKDPAFAELEGYSEFPRNPDWILTARRDLLSR